MSFALILPKNALTCSDPASSDVIKVSRKIKSLHIKVAVNHSRGIRAIVLEFSFFLNTPVAKAARESESRP